MKSLLAYTVLGLAVLSAASTVYMLFFPVGLMAGKIYLSVVVFTLLVWLVYAVVFWSWEEDQ